jgi:hypothetical protein
MALATPPVRGAGDPNSHFDGAFSSGFGWNFVGGYASIGDGVLHFEGRGDVNAYVYSDLESDALDGDFQILYRVRITSANINPNAILGAASDTIGKYSSWVNGIFTTVTRHDVVGQRFGIGYRFNSSGGHGEVVYIRPFQWEFDTWYYLTLTRAGPTATLSVYADPERMQLQGSAELANVSGRPFRFLYAFTGAWGLEHERIYGDIDDVSVLLSCVRQPEWVCDGDVDGNGVVNPVDVGIVQAFFGNTNEDNLCQYDVDCNGAINQIDAGIVQSLFGTCEEPRGPCGG